MGLDALGDLFGRTVASAEAKDDGSLLLDFGEGRLLGVPSGDGYEPWCIRGPLGTLASMSSGGLTSWRTR